MELSDKVERYLLAEIESTGLAVRDAVNSMADSFNRAMAQVEQSARAWEEAAPLNR